jgi:hypothetical protein
MEVYSTQRKLSTYSVNTQLLRDLEAYVIDKMPGIIPVTPDHPKLEGNTTLMLTHPDGTDLFTPTGKYTQSRFDNDIESAGLEFQYHDGQPVNERQAIVITIRFSRYSEDSDLTIALRTHSAQKKAAELEQGIIQRLEAHKNSNWIAYPNSGMPIFIFIAGFLAFLFALMVDNPVLKTICILLFVTAVYLFAHSFMKGYCSFDSKRQKMMDTIFKLTLGAVILFIIVSIATPLRKTLWGF